MIGKTISHYTIVEKLGAGGMAEVYKAQDTKLNRPVALKFISPGSTADTDAVKRFIQEAQTASALDHTNICTIYQIDETEDGHLFIAMAYYEGQTVRERLAGEPIAVDDALDITLQIAEGLSRAHEAGIAHRDIKPENIVITDRGEVKIIDFGIAKLASQGDRTKTGSTLGTVAYMSPEQVQGTEIDHRTDIWSLGVTLYEMLTGQKPFFADYQAAVIYSILHDDPPELEEYRPELPASIAAILSRALEKEPADRYQSARDMIADLRAVAEGVTAEVEVTSLTREPEKSSYLQDYKNDIVLSYAHLDDKPLTKGQRGWIQTFHQALEIRLQQLLGADTRIQRRDSVQVESSAQGKSEAALFDDAAIMLSIVSPQYVKSEECMKEVSGFFARANQTGDLWIGSQARIFKAIKTPVSRELQPEVLRGLPDYEFYQMDSVTGRPQEFWPEFGTDANRSFWAKLEDIAYDLYQLMEAMKTKKIRGRVASQTKSVLYLAETTHELTEHRDKIKRQLQQRGYAVLPDRPLPLNKAALEKHIRADLEGCDMSIHLIGQSYGVIPDGEVRSIPEVQHLLAIERGQNNGYSRLIWLPKGAKVEDDRQQKFVQSLKTDASAQKGADLLETSLDEFKTFLIDKLNRKEDEHKPQAIEDNIVRIYLQCDQNDLDATADLEEYLFNQGFEVKLPAFEGDESEVFSAHKENLLLCDATLIYHGQSTDSWLSTKLADLQKIAGYGRKTPMAAKAVYVAPPETKLKQRFRTREALAIKSFDDFSPDIIAPFIEAIRANG